MAIRLIDGSEFLHIPKTGGTWVKKVLRDNKLIQQELIGFNDHADYDRVVLDDMMCYSTYTGRDYLREASKFALRKVGKLVGVKGASPDPLPQRKRFCFVRHPLSWYESWWKYMGGLNWRDWGEVNRAENWHPSLVLNGLGSNDFNQFVRNVINERPGHVTELMFSYTKPGISFIGKNENLTDDLISILEMLNLPFDKE